MNKIFSREVKIALTAIVAVVLMFFGLNFLKGLSIFSNDNTYKISFTNISGLASSSPIYADGYRVGTVTDIEYNYNEKGNIIVNIELDENLRVPLGSHAEIVSDIMGNTQVNLLLANNPRERVMPGETIEGVISEGAMGDMKALIPTIQNILPKLDSIMGRLNTLLADPAVANMLHNAESVSANLKTSTSELNTMLASINRQLPGMMNTANNVLANTETVTANLAQVDVAGTMAQVDATLSNVHKLTETLNSREGSLGLLLHDPSLYNNLNSTMAHADSLMIDFKARPSRYIQFSVFGKKK